MIDPLQHLIDEGDAILVDAADAHSRQGDTAIPIKSVVDWHRRATSYINGRAPALSNQVPNFEPFEPFDDIYAVLNTTQQILKSIQRQASSAAPFVAPAPPVTAPTPPAPAQEPEPDSLEGAFLQAFLPKTRWVRRAVILIFFLAVAALAIWATLPDEVKSEFLKGSKTPPAAQASQASSERRESPVNDSSATPLPIAPSPQPSDFQARFQADRTDEGALARDAQEAFGLGQYDWTIKFLTQAQRTQTSGVWQSSYPFLYGAQLASGKLADAEATRGQMLSAVRIALSTRHGYLSHATALGILRTHLGAVRAALPAAQQAEVDSAIDEIAQLNEQTRP